MITKIRNNLYLGSHSDIRDVLKDKRINAILNLASELTVSSKDIPVWKVGMKDEASDILNNEELALRTLNEIIVAGHNVFVHCKKGRSRSAHIVAKYLSNYENRPYNEIYDEIKKIRSIASYSVEQEIIDKKLRK